jgi:hypothetical protein
MKSSYVRYQLTTTSDQAKALRTKMDKEMQHYRGNMQDKKEGCGIEEKVTNRRDGWPQTTALSESSNSFDAEFRKASIQVPVFQCNTTVRRNIEYS